MIVGALILAAKVAACVVAGLAAGWLIAKAVHFTLPFLTKKVKEWLGIPGTGEVMVTDTHKTGETMKDKLRGVLGKMAEETRKGGNVKSITELQKQAQELREGIDVFDALQRQGTSHIIGRVSHNGEVTDFDAYNNKDSHLDPEVDRHMGDGTLLITR